MPSPFQSMATDAFNAVKKPAEGYFAQLQKAASGQAKPVAKTAQIEPPVQPLTPANVELWNRPILHNPDGSVSTTLSFSIGTDKGEVLIPQVINGKKLTMQQAIEHYKQTGENLGTFKNAADADAYATWLHNEQARRIPNPYQQKGKP